MSFEERKSRADALFDRLVAPVLPEMFGATTVEWVSSEGGGELAALMDRERSVDGYIRIDGGVPVPVSKRLQWADTDYRTITIRTSRLSGHETEIHKFDRLAPDHMHLHAYVNRIGTELISVYAVRSALLPSRIKSHKVNPQDGTEFGYVYFDDVADDDGSFGWPDGSKRRYRNPL